LKIPDYIFLVFLLPFSPELYLAEIMCAKFKRAFTNKFFKAFDEVSNFIPAQTAGLKKRW